MSVSTAAVPTANTNGNHALSMDSHSSQDVRRRTVVVARKKASPELLADGGFNGTSSVDKITDKKDLSHTIRGESVLGKSKYPLEARKDAIASAAAADRRKKSGAKQEKAKWEIALSVLMKLCLLISAVAWMGQLFWRWQNGDLSFTTLDMESRLSKVEGFKKTTKMLQVQLDILDKKLGNEIDKTRRDITKQFEDKGNKLEIKMKALEGKTDKLDKSLAELRDMGFVSKKEFDEIVEQLKKKKGLDGTVGDISLDDIRLFAKEIVEMEIERHAADGLGMVDYALASGGGKVVKHSEAFRKAKSFMPSRNSLLEPAKKMLEPSFGQPGECFALQGSSGYVEIKLRTGIIPEAVSLEHVDKSVAYDRSSAPKDFQVSGWYEGPEDDSDKESRVVTNLGEFSYDLEKNNVQTFQLERTADSRVINMVRLDFSSNHGNSELTCIYRFRMHGREPGSP
ncbi:SUN domain-containing protein 1-like [Oryza glaberrima]|uniref:SUN domain-containing protein n=1 Tax=Oryza glaberrima TaxID=4538 RepID=I1PTX1_ORYGL|nr:SUN domain-containing protein 1-like [Oryza glaberrima]